MTLMGQLSQVDETADDISCQQVHTAVVKECIRDARLEGPTQKQGETIMKK